MTMFHESNRALQDRFGSRHLADRLVERLHRETFTEDDAAFIARRPFFFLATADSEGRPDCSFKGGDPGFVRVVAPDLLVWPDYDGNGMFKSLGNIRANPHVGLLFLVIGTKDSPARLRVNGTATLHEGDPLLAEFPGGQLLVRLRPRHVFPNCPRYIPAFEQTALSPYTPHAGEAAVEPAWKDNPAWKELVPPRRA